MTAAEDLETYGQNAVRPARFTSSSMKKSPSTFFSILAEEDDTKVHLKLAAAALSQGSAHHRRPDVSCPSNNVVEASLDLWTADGKANASQAEGLGGPAAGVEAAMHPAAVLQELLGDLYVDTSRLEDLGLFGQGGFAEVRRCNMAQPGGGGPKMLVAVKKLKPQVLQEAIDLQEFMAEANLLRKLRHPNIVSIKGIGATDLHSVAAMRQSMYVVMEAMCGGTLKMMVVRQMVSHTRHYSMADALRWCTQIASAMHYLHHVCKPMIMHRDLKLDNILLTSDSVNSAVAKLADFGLHKRARLSKAADILESCQRIQNESLHRANNFGPVHDRSYYGGTLFNASRHGASVQGGMLRADASTDPDWSASRGWHSVAVQAVVQPPGLPNNTSSLVPTPEPSVHGRSLPGGTVQGGTAQGRPAGGTATTIPAAAASPGARPELLRLPLEDTSDHEGQNASLASVHINLVAGRRAVSCSPKGTPITSMRSAVTVPSGRPLAKPDTTSVSNLPPISTSAERAAQRSDAPHTPKAPSSAEHSAALLSVPVAPQLCALGQALPPDERVHRRALALTALGFATNAAAAAAATKQLAAAKALATPGACAGGDDGSSYHDGRTDDCTAPLLPSIPAGAAALDAARGGGPVAKGDSSGTSSSSAGSGGSAAAGAVSEAALTMLLDHSVHDTLSRKGTMMTIPEDHNHCREQGTLGAKLLAADAASCGAAASRPDLLRLSVVAGVKAAETAAAAAGVPAAVKGGDALLVDATQQVGSLMYMAPELLTGEGHYNEKVDVFSFAMLMYELFLGKLLASKIGLMTADAATVTAYVSERSHGQRETLPTRWPEPLRTLLAACWAQDAMLRPSFTVILRELDQMQRDGVMLAADKQSTGAGSCGCAVS